MGRHIGRPIRGQYNCQLKLNWIIVGSSSGRTWLTCSQSECYTWQLCWRQGRLSSDKNKCASQPAGCAHRTCKLVGSCPLPPNRMSFVAPAWISWDQSLGASCACTVAGGRLQQQCGYGCVAELCGACLDLPGPLLGRQLSLRIVQGDADSRVEMLNSCAAPPPKNKQLSQQTRASQHTHRGALPGHISI